MSARSSSLATTFPVMPVLLAYMQHIAGKQSDEHMTAHKGNAFAS